MTMNPPDVKRKKTMAASSQQNHQDLINELPTPLLCSILSFLPTKGAVATSAVCRQWRNLWSYQTRLDLDPSCMADPLAERVGSVYEDHDLRLSSSICNAQKIISSNQSGIISSCRIVLTDLVPVEKRWIEFLKNEKKLEELIIDARKNLLPPEWPSGFFHGGKLRTLELNSINNINNASPFEGCFNLETLKLNSVSLSDETLVGIIANCEFLENLVLTDCKGLVYVDIGYAIGDHKTLKYLEIQDLHPKSFKLRAKSLRTLSLTNFSCPWNDISCPNIDVLRVYGDKEVVSRSSEVLLSRFTGLMGSKDISMAFCGLRRLETNFDLENWYDLASLRCIFIVWTNLEQLHIINQAYDHDYRHLSVPYHHEIFWQGVLPDSITNHLKIVQLRGFGGHDKEMSLVTHLIKHGEALQRLAIHFVNAVPALEKKAKKELLSMKRASANVLIVLTSEKKLEVKNSAKK